VKRAIWIVLGVLVLGVAALTVAAVGIAIWPGSMKLTAPVLCSADQPDPFVVRTTTSDSDGTSTSFSLFCMGDRGDFTEVGTWEPFGLLILYTWGLFLALTALIVARIRWRRWRRGRDEVPGPAPVADAPGPVSPIS
jgi:hypothetical protein